MKTHPLNITYLVLGLVFLGLSGSWALRQTGVVDSSATDWLAPLVLVVAGAAGLLAIGLRGLHGRDRSYDRGYDQSYDQTPTPTQHQDQHQDLDPTSDLNRGDDR